MKFGEKTREKIVEQVGGLITDYMQDLDAALVKCGDALSISISAKIAPNSSGNQVTTTLTFTKEKVSDSQKAYVDEAQTTWIEKD